MTESFVVTADFVYSLLHGHMKANHFDKKIRDLLPYIPPVKFHLARISHLLCEAGGYCENKTLDWFRNILDLNKDRYRLVLDISNLSENGILLNVMHVLVNFCNNRIRSNPSEMLGMIDPSYPQSPNHIDFCTEPRVAANSELLSQWWDDDSNPAPSKELNFETKCWNCLKFFVTFSCIAEGTTKSQQHFLRIMYCLNSS